jgi:hypothetical protein
MMKSGWEPEELSPQLYPDAFPASPEETKILHENVI